MKVMRLQYKDIAGSYHESDGLTLLHTGIQGAKLSHQLRQVLLLNTETLEEFNISFGQLHENILLENARDLYALPSGTRLQLGSAVLSLTYLCEPCKKVSHLVNPSRIEYKRGYLAKIINAGVVSLGDEVNKIHGVYDAPIPHDLRDRVAWFINNSKRPVTCKEVVDGIGMSSSYCRAIPAIVRKNPNINREKIIAPTLQEESSAQLQLI